MSHLKSKSKHQSGRITFTPMTPPSPKIYFYTSSQTLTSFYALIQAVDLINKYDGRMRVGLAFTNPVLKTLAEAVTWTSLPALMVDELDGSNIPVVALDPKPSKVIEYQVRDNAKDFELETTRLPHIAPEQLKLPDFYYSAATAIIRDAYEVFDIMPGGRPVNIFEEVRRPRYLSGSKVASAAQELLYHHGIKSGPFTLVENRFAGWWDTSQDTPKDWGRVICLPSAADLLNPDAKINRNANNNSNCSYSLLGYLGLMSHPQCAALGIVSTDYILPSVAAWQVNKHTVWDLRPCQANIQEDLTQRDLMTQHLPGGTVSISLIHPTVDEPAELIQRELVYAVGYYNKEYKQAISHNKRRTLPPRPTPPSLDPTRNNPSTPAAIS